MTDCVFCRDIPRVIENSLSFAVYDINPASKGHALIIPKRHVEQIFDVTAEEWSALRDLVIRMKILTDREHAPDGYNVWVNSGRAAGQVVMHAHIHLIPRYKGQVLHMKDHLKGNIE